MENNFSDFQVKTKIEFWLRSDDEPEDYVTSHEFELEYLPEESNVSAIVGVAKTLHVRIAEAIENEIPPEDVFDAHSADLWDIYESIFKNEAARQAAFDQFNLPYLDSLFVINRCAIDPKFRGKKLGHQFIRRIIEILAGSADLVVCKPFPLTAKHAEFFKAPTEWFESDFDLDGIQRFWSKMGFQRVQDSGIYAAHFYDLISAPSTSPSTDRDR